MDSPKADFDSCLALSGRGQDLFIPTISPVSPEFQTVERGMPHPLFLFFPAEGLVS